MVASILGGVLDGVGAIVVVEDGGGDVAKGALDGDDEGEASDGDGGAVAVDGLDGEGGGLTDVAALETRAVSLAAGGVDVGGEAVDAVGAGGAVLGLELDGDDEDAGGDRLVVAGVGAVSVVLDGDGQVLSGSLHLHEEGRSSLGHSAAKLVDGLDRELCRLEALLLLLHSWSVHQALAWHHDCLSSIPINSIM